jgi:hypothetical protein
MVRIPSLLGLEEEVAIKETKTKRDMMMFFVGYIGTLSVSSLLVYSVES